jgi:DNA helicase-2/ATP-dependent DNA helicase PcrA
MARQFNLSLDPDDARPPVRRTGGLDAQTILDGLNSEQQEAASAVDGPVLIIAGPGSGKTRTLTHRIAYLLATGRAKPWQILALTFTNKAAREMRERAVNLVGPEAGKGLMMGTFHSTFARVLRVEGERLGYSRDFSIYDSDDSERIVRTLMQRLRLDAKTFTPRAMRGLISSAKNAMVSPDEYARMTASAAQETAAKLYPVYENALRQANAMDFDDLLLKPLELFDGHADVKAKYQQKWRYLHIDEYQDTNTAQYRIARTLAEQHKNLCVVGDDAQSIYAFRGADITNILSFQKDYPEARTVRLEQNYRSTKRILQLADSVIKQNSGQLKKDLHTDNDEGDYVVLMESLSEKDEAQKVERTIRDYQLRGGYGFKDFAILYRTNAQSRSIEDQLRRAGIPYRLVGGVSFYSRKEIKDALAYLRLLVNPNDVASIRRIINYPTRGIGDKTVGQLVEASAERGLTLWQVMEQPEDAGLSTRAATAVEKFRFMIDQHTVALAKQPADEVARDLLAASGLLGSFKEEKTLEAQARWENVQELLNGLAEHVQAREDHDLATFLQDITLLTDADSQQDDQNVVTLMTLHASKGLEFPVVFITGMEEGLFPLAKAAQDPSDLEEERRLFYVGITRAESNLFITYARSRFRYGQHESSVRSRFLDEIDPSVVRTEAGTAPDQKQGRFTSASSKGSSAAYRGVDPHYYRQSLRPDAPTKPRRTVSVDTERRVVYDEEVGQIVPGVEVEHERFGLGKVLALEGNGPMAKATVFFNDYGQKKLVLKFAGLRQIG